MLTNVCLETSTINPPQVATQLLLLDMSTPFSATGETPFDTFSQTSNSSGTCVPVSGDTQRVLSIYSRFSSFLMLSKSVYLVIQVSDSNDTQETIVLQTVPSS